MNRQIWRFLDHSTFGSSFSALESFAYDDTLCTLVGASDDTVFIRTWVHHNTVVLGIQDSRLPYVKDGQAYLEQAGYRTIVRNSGGLAVLLDDGVLNISLIMKDEKGLSIDAAYEKMYGLIKTVFAPFHVTIEAYEINGSYCPGSFDLSIGGKKFAGISQRRIRGGVTVQIYLCVDGSGSERAATIGEFYRFATREEKTKFDYPLIVPSTMASLRELLNEPLTVADVMSLLLETIKQEGISLLPHTLTAEEMSLFSKQYKRMIERNEKLL